MIGFLFLGAAILWLIVVYQVTRRVPKWLHLERHGWIAQAAVALVLLIGPFADHIVGMRQFERLCKERAAVVSVTPQAKQVKRARRLPIQDIELPGNWIRIQAQQIAYADRESGEVFARFEILHTKGGRIAGLALLGGEYSCSPPSPNALNELDIDRLLKEEKSNEKN